MWRVTLQPVFVLHTRPFRDTSLLVDALTLNHGRVHLLARNARGLRSRFKGVLQPFVPFLASWSGKTDLMYLSAVEANGSPFYLSGVALISGLYLNELLVRLLYRYDPHPNIYKAYQYALVCLQRSESPEQILRLFEKQLLAELGYGLELNKEVSGEAIVADQAYRLDPERGFMKSFDKTHFQSAVFSGKSLLAFYSGELQNLEDLREIKRLMRLVLAPLLGDKPIKSRELFV
jgi:DNA repair protein RecO (recombination protein O)